MKLRVAGNMVIDDDSSRIVAYYYENEILFRKTSLTPKNVLKIVEFYQKWIENEKKSKEDFSQSVNIDNW